MLDEFNALALDIISRAKGRTIIYIPNPGNWGDALIRYGTKLFFQDFGIAHIEINIGFKWGKWSLLPFLFPLLSEKYFFIYGGGGAWCSAYHGGRDAVQLLSFFTHHILVLPTTYELFGHRIHGTFYTRGVVESLRVVPTAIFCHDMALYVAARSFGEASALLPMSQKVGVFLRNDKESAMEEIEKPETSSDISAKGDHMSNGDSLIALMAGYEEVFTDRLHVAIAGCVANCRVHLTAGNYFKIREVYLASMKDFFPNLIFYEDQGCFMATMQDHLLAT